MYLGPFLNALVSSTTFDKDLLSHDYMLDMVAGAGDASVDEADRTTRLLELTLR